MRDQPRTAGWAGALLVAAALVAVWPQTAAAQSIDARHVQRARAFMQELRAESRRDARRITEIYGHASGAFSDRDDLAGAIAAGIVRPVPLDERAFNVRPRLQGAHPIGELDLPHQRLYAAAQPSTLGVLLQIASRVRSTSLDVTSLVRHEAYQHRLGVTNPNARTSVPTHTLGLAFDISILHVPLASAREIRDVLRQMREAGDLFFVAETRQLVFHVVVAPARAGFHAATFDALVRVTPPPWVAPALPAAFALSSQLPPVPPDPVRNVEAVRWVSTMPLLAILGAAALLRLRPSQQNAMA